MSDKSIKNKAERERRFREINENNMKFLEERKRLKMRHYRQVELLKKIHQWQLEKFNKESEKDLADMVHTEAKLATKPETDV